MCSRQRTDTLHTGGHLPTTASGVLFTQAPSLADGQPRPARRAGRQRATAPAKANDPFPTATASGYPLQTPHPAGVRPRLFFCAAPMNRDTPPAEAVQLRQVCGQLPHNRAGRVTPARSRASPDSTAGRTAGVFFALSSGNERTISAPRWTVK